ASAHQHGCEEIDQKRIGKANTGVSGVLRRKILSLGEAVDDLKMQRQVAKIVGDAGVDAVWPLKDGPAEDHRQKNGNGEIERQIADANAGASRWRSVGTQSRQNRSAQIVVQKQQQRQEQQKRGQNDR